MEITRQADYAVRTVLDLARLPMGQRVRTGEIAERQRIPPTFLAKIVAQLSVAGLVRTTRGAQGGLTLARPPEEITLLEVVETIDGPVMLNSCASHPEHCPFGASCVVQHVWADVQAAVTDRLRATTFADLANGNYGGMADMAPSMGAR
ncbi:MAG: Rrf2 family transcriptional regulator [Chloroflexi bacterium]|nr:Rrf2 family transcriptional regulator [Chloroflexota bacterium]